MLPPGENKTQKVALGDGSGVVRLKIGPAGSTTSGRFQGEIDNLTVSEPAAAVVTAPVISQFVVDPAANQIHIRWQSAQGLSYALLSNTDLSIPVASWPVYNGLHNLSATPPENSLLLSPTPPESRRFFSIRVSPAQP